jgi:hypothetical protein
MALGGAESKLFSDVQDAFDNAKDAAHGPNIGAIF